VKSGEEWHKLFTRASYLATDICAILVKSVFESGLLFTMPIEVLIKTKEAAENQRLL
jgi:hypothetical protein